MIDNTGATGGATTVTVRVAVAGGQDPGPATEYVMVAVPAALHTLDFSLQNAKLLKSM